MGLRILLIVFGRFVRSTVGMLCLFVLRVSVSFVVGCLVVCDV